MYRNVCSWRQGHVHISPRTFYTDCKQIYSYDKLSGALSKASGAVARPSCQELSLSSFSYCPGIVFGTEKIKVFLTATGDIQAFCFFIAPFALSLRLMPCLLLIFINSTPGCHTEADKPVQTPRCFWQQQGKAFKSQAQQTLGKSPC